MFSPPSLTIIRCSNATALKAEIDQKLPSEYAERYLPPPVCTVEDDENLVLSIPNRFDTVSPKRHPCDIKNYTEQLIIVDASCGAAVLRGADIFAPGVLTPFFKVVVNFFTR